MDQETRSGAGQDDSQNGPDKRAAALSPSVPAGDPQVDEVLRPLGGLAGRPVAEHPQVLERIHAELVEVLGELGPAAGAAG